MLKPLTILLFFIVVNEYVYAQVKLFTINTKNTAELKEFFGYTPDRIPLVVAHRGGDRIGYPENSIATFENTLTRMHALFEIDPRLTKDGVIVAFHDETLDRTTNGTGNLADYTWEELKHLRLKDAEGNITPYKMHTLEEVLKWAKGKTILVLDKKDVPLNRLLSLIEANEAESYVLISAFSVNDAKYYYSRNSKLMFEAVVETEAEMNAYEAAGIPWENIVAFTRRTDTSNDGIPENVNTLLNQKFRQKGVMCMLSTMKYQDKEKNRAIRVAGYKGLVAYHGIDIILTDRASELSAALQEFVPAVSTKSKFFQQGIYDSEYSQAVTDIDGNIYNTVTIGNQVWTSSNLKVSRYRNGDPIVTGLDNSAWSTTTSGAYSIYPFAEAREDNAAIVKDKYGLLYNGYAVNDQKNIAPVGWRVATDADWKKLETYNGMATNVLDLSDWRNTDGEGQKLKSEEEWTWDAKSGTDKYGFNALPGGFRAATGTYGQVKNRAYFWTGSTSGKTVPSNWRRILEYSKISIHRVDISRNEGYSVRLIKEDVVTEVDLVSFTAKKGSVSVNLSWETVSEHNNDYFMIERSNDSVNFSRLSKIPGKGISNTRQFYALTDNSPFAGLNYYRLMQYDKDGKATNYGVRVVHFDLEHKSALTAFPNPLKKNSLGLNLSGYPKGLMLVTLTDIGGAIVFRATVNIVEHQELYTLNFNTNLAAGLYVLNLTGNNISKSLRLIVDK